jgi:inorganic pyrophosphatase
VIVLPLWCTFIELLGYPLHKQFREEIESTAELIMLRPGGGFNTGRCVSKGNHDQPPVVRRIRRRPQAKLPRRGASTRGTPATCDELRAYSAVEYAWQPSWIFPGAMARARKRHETQTSPLPVDDHDPALVRVVVETPKGSRNKYVFEPRERIFRLKKVLPAGMAFPFDFGFIPATLADDGDPIDVLVLMDEPAFPGCVVKCRLVGVIEGEQTQGKRTKRNDRVLAVEHRNQLYAGIRCADDLGRDFLRQLQTFFVNYHQGTGKEYRVNNVRGPKAAYRRVKAGFKAARKAA